MTKILKALKWRVCGNYDPEGPVTEDRRDRALNRAKYEVWRYNTFGPGRHVYNSDFAYQIIDSRELENEPLYIHDPWDHAGMALIIAEMEGHKYLTFLEPRLFVPLDKKKQLELVDNQTNGAIDRVVGFFKHDINKDFCKSMLETLVQYHKEKKSEK